MFLSRRSLHLIKQDERETKSLDSQNFCSIWCSKVLKSLVNTDTLANFNQHTDKHEKLLKDNLLNQPGSGIIQRGQTGLLLSIYLSIYIFIHIYIYYIIYSIYAPWFYWEVEESCPFHCSSSCSHHFFMSLLQTVPWKRLWDSLPPPSSPER